MTDFYNFVPLAPEGRFDNVTRTYAPEYVMRLRGSVAIKYSLAEMYANRLWELVSNENFVNASGSGCIYDNQTSKGGWHRLL